MEKSIVVGCTVRGTPGWGMVHHDCACDFFNNGVYKMFGAGIVSEQGSELGAWNNNLVMHTTWIGEQNPFTGGGIGNLGSGPKTAEGAAGSAGLGGRRAYGYYYRGRAIRGNGNVACSVGFGHAFYPRTVSNSGMIVPVKDVPRNAIDISEAGYIRNTGLSIGEGTFNHVDYPILHMADNVSMACVYGHFITKQRVDHDHDVNVKVKRPKSYGVGTAGFLAEYVGTYIVEHADAVGRGNGGQTGNGTGSQSMQVMMMYPRGEFPNGSSVNMGMKSTSKRSDLFDNIEDPRYGVIGSDDLSKTAIAFPSQSENIKPGVDVTFIDPDWDGTRIDYDRDPNLSAGFPFIVGEITGSGLNVVNFIDNDTFFKEDNLSNAARIIEKRGKDYIFPTQRADVVALRNENGRWQVGGVECVIVPFIISDRLTGRPAKYIRGIELSGADITGTDNGAFTLPATPVSVSNPNLTYATPMNTPITINLVSDAVPANGGGSYEIDPGFYAGTKGDEIGADYGTTATSGDRQSFTYTPDPDRIGTDEFYKFIYCGQGTWATVRINILVNAAGTEATPETPVHNTHFVVADHADANTISVKLELDKPDTDRRRIDLVQYSTDAGATWRRLCNGWIGDFHKVTVESDGTAIAPGSYNVRIRYKTDHEYGFSTASGDAAVTVA
jgi:hypothetical protein